eukprot:CAMPEP_0178694648 /NCGR_PEP_ID=MMETSP0699-20121125/8370_1 /TAXON_ID=265572 /ORGANISM="Extubocellulus spinifer, Strain CCMP396" /LENGTH=44 /DNA_ID= /DNA_START= /DNA_END= /DNA_ORIENTATION=
MPIFKKGSRARERERGAGNRGGGGAPDGNVQDQRNAERIERRQQ